LGEIIQINEGRTNRENKINKQEVSHKKDKE
jgi:hypothetical protein